MSENMLSILPKSGPCLPPPVRLKDLQRCGQVMKPPFKGGQGMSTNDKACYDKLDKAIVPLSRLDDCAQSTSLRTFFFLPLARDSVTSFQSRSWGATDTPTHNYTSPSTPIAPMPRRHYPYQRLSVLCGQMKGKMWFWRKKKMRKRKKM